MKKRISVLVAGLYSLAVFFGAAALVPRAVLAHDGEDHSTTETVAAEESSEATAATYKYVAQAGDSYSLMARKAVQTYGLTNKVNLSEAKIIAAETWITQAAESPELTLDQSVEIKESIVKDNIDKASKISAEAEAAWAQYADGVNFNTDAVGQAR